MKKNFLLIFITVITITLKAQSKFTSGIGLSNNMHFFQHKDKTVRNNIFKPSIVNLFGFNAFIDFETNNLFDFRMNLSVGKKKIVFANKYQLPGIGARVKSTFSHELVFADISFLTLLNIHQSKINWHPIIGFFVSANQYLGFIQGSKVSNGNNSQNNTPPVDLFVGSFPFTVYAGINLGAVFKFRIKERQLEFQILSYLSPINSFRSDFSTQTNSTQNMIQGKYQYISFGINAPFRKRKK